MKLTMLKSSYLTEDGYTNVLVPENGYRTSIMYGWTGKELVYADIVNKLWDEKDAEKQS